LNREELLLVYSRLVQCIWCM